jgi:hypothetical protein
VRNRSRIFNVTNLNTSRSQSANRRFTPRARATHTNFYAADTVVASHAGSILRGLLRGKWCSFARSAETQRPGTLPGQHISGLIGNSHNRVVERSLDVGNSVRNMLPLFFLKRFFLALFIRRRCSGSRCRWCCWFCHSYSSRGSSVFGRQPVPASQRRILLTTDDRVSTFWLPISSCQPLCLCAGLCGCARWCECVVRGPGGSGDDDSRGRSRFR